MALALLLLSPASVEAQLRDGSQIRNASQLRDDVAVLAQAGSSDFADLAALTLQFTPVGEDVPGAFLESRLPTSLRTKLFDGSRRTDRRPLAAFRPFTPLGSGDRVIQAADGGSTGGSSGVPAWESECTTIKDAVTRRMLNALRASLDYVIQDGAVDFGLTGEEGEQEACGGNGCAFSNPSSPYGLTLLPLAPEEDAERKSRAGTTPKSVATELADGSSGSDRLLGSRRDRGSDSGSSAGNVYAEPGFAPVYQLRPDEVVIVSGCLPPADSSRYFAFTPYTYATYDNTTGGGSWVNVFASMGDTASVVSRSAPCLEPDASSGRGQGDGCTPVSGQVYGQRSRLNASLPSDYKEIDAVLSANANSSTAWWMPKWALDWVPGVQAQNGGGGAGGSGGAGEGDGKEGEQPVAGSLPTAHERFTVFVMTASPAAAREVGANLASALRWQNIVGAINVVPIPQEPFGTNIGLEPRSPYYMLMARNIVPTGGKDAFKAYLAADPWSVWRLTPTAPIVSGGILSNFLLGSGGGSGSSSSSSKTNSSDSEPGGFAMTQVVPRVPASVPNQGEEWLRPAFQYLEDRIQTRYGGFAQAWSLISGSYLQSLGIDWGADCVERMVEACNGDNRDAQYVSAFPLVQLDKASKPASLNVWQHSNPASPIAQDPAAGTSPSTTPEWGPKPRDSSARKAKALYVAPRPDNLPSTTGPTTATTITPSGPAYCTRSKSA
ncbi:hypothetical protein FOA52_000400, partial [Chlamydomonas sp. UWO 241]